MALRLTLQVVNIKEKKRVAWAECDSDLADALLSFLAMPLGAVVNLLGGDSKLGRVDELYKSVADMEERYFATGHCRGMLLRPRSSFDARYPWLALWLDDDAAANHPKFYTCSCCVEKKLPALYSAVEDARCSCGSKMGRLLRQGKRRPDPDGVFVAAGRRFILSDDLCLSPASAWATLKLMANHRSDDDDGDPVERTTVNVYWKQVLKLLVRSVSSSTSPLTEFLLEEPGSGGGNTLPPPPPTDPIVKEEEGSETHVAAGNEPVVRVTLLLSAAGDKVLLAEVGEDFLDLIFGFLTMPVGSIARLLNGTGCGCIDNLYASAEKLCTRRFVALWAPKLAPHHGSTVGCRLLGVEEASGEMAVNACGCKRCALFFAPACIHGKDRVTALEVNPKLDGGSVSGGGGFVKGKFFVGDDMVVISPSASVLQVMDDLGISVERAQERVVTVGKKEAVALLGALLRSTTPLTDVFCARAQLRHAGEFKSQNGAEP